MPRRTPAWMDEIFKREQLKARDWEKHWKKWKEYERPKLEEWKTGPRLVLRDVKGRFVKHSE